METSEHQFRRTLNGWKEISQHLGKSIRSAQRAEADQGLPIHRIRTPTGQIVYANSDELDRWQREASQNVDGTDSEPPNQRFTLRRVAVTLFVGVGLLLIGALASHSLRPAREPAHFRLIGRTLEALDQEGAIVWTYLFDRDVSSPRREEQLDPQVVDIDGDGEREVLLPVRSTFDGVRPTMSDSLFCFSLRGDRKWSITPDRSLTFGSHRFAAPWVLTGLVAVPDRRKLWLSFNHHTWWPGFILEVSSTGVSRLQYVQDGRIFALTHRKTSGGDFLLAAGVSVRLSEGTIVFLGLDDAASAFPDNADRRFTCDACPAEAPRRILRFPSLDVTRSSFLHPEVIRLAHATDGLVATIREGASRSTALLDSELAVRALLREPGYWRHHKELEERGHLDHSATDCPERRVPRIVGEWTPAAGWRELPILMADEDS